MARVTWKTHEDAGQIKEEDFNDNFTARAATTNSFLLKDCGDLR